MFFFNSFISLCIRIKTFPCTGSELTREERSKARIYRTELYSNHRLRVSAYSQKKEEKCRSNPTPEEIELLQNKNKATTKENPHDYSVLKANVSLKLNQLVNSGSPTFRNEKGLRETK